LGGEDPILAATPGWFSHHLWVSEKGGTSKPLVFPFFLTSQFYEKLMKNSS